MNERSTIAGFGRWLQILDKILRLLFVLVGTLAWQIAVAAPQDDGTWGPVLPWPHIAVSAANLPNGKILTYSGSERDTWPSTEKTWSATWDPSTGVHVEILHTGHNMFCAHLSMMEDGRVFVNGGRNQTNSPWTTLFDYQDGPNGGWTQIQNMATGGRWYPTTLTLGDGSIFTAVGTATNPSNPEMWDAVNGWQIKNGISFNSMVLNPYSGSHGERQWWPLLHLAPNGEIFHSGPTPQMHYINPMGNGSYTQEGAEFTDWYHKHGTSVMYDEGKILTAGGWIAGNNSTSTNRVFTVNLNGPAPAVTVMPLDSGNPTLSKSMHFARKYHNGVMGPTGEVYIFGGNENGQKFNDDGWPSSGHGSILAVEIWNPLTEQFRVGASMSIPRNYHSVALLLTDGRMLSAGGGYCSSNPTCGGASHPDAQVYTPPYLYNSSGNLATRPSITSGPGFITGGQSFNVQATAGLQKFSLIRMSSTTHGVNTDVRFLNVPFTEVSPGSYDLTTTGNQNVLVPGYWMLFALNSNGVPSVAHVVRANSGGGLPWINTPADQITAISTPGVNLQLIAGDGDNDPLTYSATGLPPGLSVNPTSGMISGATTTTTDTYQVTATVNDFDEGAANASFQWTVYDPAAVCPDCLNFNLVPTSAYSSQDEHANVTVEDGGATLALADNTWRRTTQTFNITDDTVLEFDYSSTGQAEVQGIGFDENNSYNDATRIFKLYGTQTWGNLVFDNYTGGLTHYMIPVGQYYTGAAMNLVFANDFDAGPGIGTNGRFSNVRIFENVSGNLPPTISNPGNQTTPLNAIVSLTVVATDPNPSDILTFSDLGLPPGLAINSSTGEITGIASTLGNFSVTITVDDGNGGSDSAAFDWFVCDPAIDCSLLDFNTLTTTSYSNQDEHANVTVEDGGATLALADNTWRRTTQTFNITSGTVLEFDFDSTAEGEIQGIGFDENNVANDATRIFQLYGTQNWAFSNTVFNDFDGGGSTHYVIPVGDYYTGGAMYLFFANDYDAGPGIGTNGRFSNVRLFDTTEQITVVDPIPTQSGLSATVSVIPNVAGMEYKWNFGDGTGDTPYGPETTFNHTYTTPGLYVVSVTVRDPITLIETPYTFTQLIHAPLTANKPSISNSIAVHPVQQQVWNVNPDNDSVTVINSVTNTVAAEVAVGGKPNTLAFAPDGTAWVVNKGSATISVVDSASLIVIDTIQLDSASQPYGIAFNPAAAQAFVTLEATGDLVQLDANSRTELGRVYVGPDPRHLSVVADGSTVYVSRFVTPRLTDESTDKPIIGFGAAAEPIGLFELQQGTPTVASYIGGEVLEVDVATLTTDLLNPIVLRWRNNLVSESTGPGLPNYLGPPVISPDDLGIWVPSKQDNILAGALRGGQGMTFDQTVRAVTSKIDRTIGDEIVNDRIDHDNASIANHAAFDLYGAHLYSTLEGNREVAVSNAYTGVEVYRFDVGQAPRGVAVSSDGNTLYVHNFMDRTVGVYDISEIAQRNNLVVSETTTVSTVATESLSANVLLGKQLFYDARDPRLTAGPYMACASCHNDGRGDGRIWDFTGVGEGLRSTISLEGRAGTGHGFLHWSANFDEVHDFEANIRAVAGGTGLMSDTDFFGGPNGTRFQPLGDPKAGVSPDLDALAAYVSSLNRVPDSPYRNSDGTLSAQAEIGKLVFEANACADCHTPSLYTDSSLPTVNLHDVGTLTTNSGSRLGGPLTGLDTPTLLGVWETGPYLHDGSALDLTEAIQAHTGIPLTPQERDDIAMYLQELDSVTGNGCADCLDFTTLTTTSYSNQDEYGNVTVEDGGATLALADNTWRRTTQTFNITANTVLEFDYDSTAQAEVQGIGFDENDVLNDAVRIFQLYGTQNWVWSNDNFSYIGGGPTHFIIPVGQFYFGNAMRLVFANDFDRGPGIGTNGRFSNVRIYEAPP